MTRSDKILILGGTAEAAALAHRLVQDKGVEVITSLAGRSIAPRALPGHVCVGGFGGAEGLADYLREEKIDRVIDATHPFAARISAHAEIACARLGIPLEKLERRMWRKRPCDIWHWADNMAMAARIAARSRRVFITVGTKELAPFARRGGPFYLIRLIAEQPLSFRHYALVLGRGPFAVDEEMALLRAFDIDLVVSKASGGVATEAKIIAARKLRIPVLLVKRPPKG